MRLLGGLVLMGVMGCASVEDRALVEIAVLPMQCAKSVGLTSTGVWACLARDGRVMTSRGDGASLSLPGTAVAVAGVSIWTWEKTAHLTHFEQDSLTPAVVRIPDAAFEWTGGPVAQDVRSFVAGDRVIVFAAGVMQVIAAQPSGFTELSAAQGRFSNSGHTGNTAHGLLDLGTTYSAFGPRPTGSAEWGACGFGFDRDSGFWSGAVSAATCDPVPDTLVGIASGGMWLSSGREAIRFYRPLDGHMTLVEGLELPRLEWVRGGVPWVIDPDDARRMLVPRVQGDQLIIDRYTASPGNTWAGANERWVWETGSTTTNVYSR